MLSKDLAYPSLANVDTAHDWDKDGALMDISSDEGIQYTPIDTSSNASVPSTSPLISRTPSVSPYEEQEAPQDMLQQVQKTDKAPAAAAAASSRASRRQASPRVTPKRQYSCNICKKIYSQPQGVLRHQRETHKANLCTHCHSFEWGRPYRLKQHLKRWHPEVVDIDAAIREAVEMRGKATKDSECLSRQRISVSPPTTQQDRQMRAVTQPGHSLELTLLADSPPGVMRLPPPGTPPYGISPEATHLTGIDAKTEEQWPLRRKIGLAPGPGCGIHTRRRSRGFGAAN
jgi:hypothetical protein